MPRPPDDAAQERTRLTAVLSLARCVPPESDPTKVERPLLELMVEAVPGGTPTTVPFGDGERLLRRLTESSCPGAEAAAK